MRNLSEIMRSQLDETHFIASGLLMEKQTIKDFKESITIGRYIRLVKSESIDRNGNWIEDINHKGVGLLRMIAAKETKNLVFKFKEGPKDGCLTFLAWPSAGCFSFDNTGFQTWELSEAGNGGMRLTYAYVDKE